MTEAGWTRTKPTVAGWYWYKDPDYPVPTILYIQVILEPAAFWGSGVKHALKSVHGEWLGPISPTDRQQGRVAGLRQAGEAYIKYLMNPEYRKSWETFDEWCRWMAQQGGGGGC